MALARRRHSPDEEKFADNRTDTWLSQDERDAVAIAFLGGVVDEPALQALVGYDMIMRSWSLSARKMESWTLELLARKRRCAAVGRWADARGMPHYLAERHFGMRAIEDELGL